MIFKKITFLFVLFIAITAVVFASGNNEDDDYEDDDYDEIVFAVDSTWPPFEYIDENKEIVGFSIDLVNAMGEAAGFVPKFVSTAWDGIFVGLANGEYDAISSSVTITEERAQTMDFSEPYFNAGQILAMRNDNSQGVSQLSDLAGRTVGAQLGTVGAFLVEENADIELKTYDTIGLAIEDLANGNIDGIVADTPLVADMLKNEKYTDLFVTVGDPMTKEEYGFVVDKGETELLEKINAGLKAVKDNGTYDEILKKWGLL